MQQDNTKSLAEFMDGLNPADKAQADLHLSLYGNAFAEMVDGRKTLMHPSEVKIEASGERAKSRKDSRNGGVITHIGLNSQGNPKRA